MPSKSIKLSLGFCSLIVFQVFLVNGSGIYMKSYREKAGMKIQFLPPPMIDKLNVKLAESLKEIDELYSKCNGIEIRELTILELQHLFATNQLTSLVLTECYLRRIQHMNPSLNAVIQVNPDAMKQAYQADLERAKYKGYSNNYNNNSMPLLLGVPILLKDNIGTKDFTETTAGSLALLGLKPINDADIVKALRKAGVVILGKTNLSEFANFRGTNIPNGWSGRGGQTRNTYNLQADPLGSSSGSAVGVAANLAMVAVGTETDGSLLAPASVGGLCTIKPTLGNPSTKGVVPLSHSQDNVGPMTRTVMDMAILLDTLMVTENRRYFPPCGNSYTNCLLKKIMKDKMRVGVARYPFWDSSIVNSTDLSFELPYLENILNIMKSSSEFEVVDPVEYPIELLKRISGTKELIVLTHDFKHDLNEYLARDVSSVFLPRRINNLRDIIQFNIDHPNPEGYNQELLIISEATDGLLNKTYLEAKQSNLRAAQELLDFMLGTYQLDAVMVPTEPRIQAINDDSLNDAPIPGYSMAAVAGYPSVNVPAGIGIDGVPFGLAIIGKPHSEARLLRIAHAIEQLAPRRQRPQFFV